MEHPADYLLDLVRDNKYDSIKMELRIDFKQDCPSDYYLNYRDQGSSCMIAASLNKEYNTSQLLLDAGAFVDIMDGEGYTSLHIAVRGNNYPLVCLLLRWDADPNFPDAIGRTALHLAAENFNRDII